MSDWGQNARPLHPDEVLQHRHCPMLAIHFQDEQNYMPTGTVQFVDFLVAAMQYVPDGSC